MGTCSSISLLLPSVHSREGRGGLFTFRFLTPVGQGHLRRCYNSSAPPGFPCCKFRKGAPGKQDTMGSGCRCCQVAAAVAVGRKARPGGGEVVRWYTRASIVCPCLVFIITISCQPLPKILHGLNPRFLERDKVLYSEAGRLSCQVPLFSLSLAST